MAKLTIELSDTDNGVRVDVKHGVNYLTVDTSFLNNTKQISEWLNRSGADVAQALNQAGVAERLGALLMEAMQKMQEPPEVFDPLKQDLRDWYVTVRNGAGEVIDTQTIKSAQVAEFIRNDDNLELAQTNVLAKPSRYAVAALFPGRPEPTLVGAPSDVFFGAHVDGLRVVSPAGVANVLATDPAIEFQSGNMIGFRDNLYEVSFEEVLVRPNVPPSPFDPPPPSPTRPDTEKA